MWDALRGWAKLVSQVGVSGWCLRLVSQVGVSGWCLRLVSQVGVSGWCLRLVSQVGVQVGVSVINDGHTQRHTTSLTPKKISHTSINYDRHHRSPYDHSTMHTTIDYDHWGVQGCHTTMHTTSPLYIYIYMYTSPTPGTIIHHLQPQSSSTTIDTPS